MRKNAIKKKIGNKKKDRKKTKSKKNKTTFSDL